MKTPPFKKTTIAAALSTLLIAPMSSGAFAQQASDTVAEKIEKIEKITITTSTRAPKAIDKIPGAISVISTEEVVESLTVTEDLSAVLTKMVPGYSEASQSMVTTGETLRGRTALFLFDGVPLSSPLRETGRNNSTFTDLGVVERIEVINGPSAAEGIGASGGIIHYLTGKPKKIGTEVTMTAKSVMQSGDDAMSWKLGFNVAHKNDDYDVLLAASTLNRGMAYDARGRMLGLQVSGSTMDSEEKNLYLKAGLNLGDRGEQRLTGSISLFDLRGLNNYRPLNVHFAPGDPTDTSIKGVIPGTQPQFNTYNHYTLKYENNNLWGGALNILGYKAMQRARFATECGTTDCQPIKADLSNLNRGKQDPNIAPLGTLFDASEVHSVKDGVRSSWNTESLAGIAGLGLNAGVDVVQDTTEQRLALTNRLWVPPMKYSSMAPFAQLSYDAGPVTLSGGLRHEDGKLKVDSYTTVWANRPASQNTCGSATNPCLPGYFVQGSAVDYGNTLPNLGVIFRMPQGWSAFASYSKGFTLPNVGIPLRNVNRDGVSVRTVAGTEAIVSDNKEIGATWRGGMASVTGSVYRSYSELGASLSVDPATRDYVMTRQPIENKGFELSGEYNFSKSLKANAMYSKIRSKIRVNPTLTVQQGITNVSPDKFVSSVTWKFSERGSIHLGETTLMDRDINIGIPGREEHTKGYTLFDLGAHYDLKKHGAVDLGIENLANKYYVLTYSQINFFQNYIAGRGRTISLTYRLKF